MIGKKAEVSTEMLHLTWRILLLAAIVVVTVSMISGVFSSKQDIRPAENALLARAVTNCIAPNGIADVKFNLNKCITTNTEGYFVNATIFSLESNFSKSESFDLKSIKNDCLIAAKGVQYLQAPICASSKSYILISNNGKLEEGIIEVETGIRKVAQNV